MSLRATLTASSVGRFHRWGSLPPLCREATLHPVLLYFLSVTTPPARTASSSDDSLPVTPCATRPLQPSLPRCGCDCGCGWLAGMSFSSSLSDYWRAFEFSTVSDHCLASISSSSFCCLPFLHLWPFSRGEYADLDEQAEASASSWAPPTFPSSSSSISSSSPSFSSAPPPLQAPVALPVFSSPLASSTFSSPERLTQSLAITGSPHSTEWRPSDVLLYGDDDVLTPPTKAKSAKKAKKSSTASPGSAEDGRRAKAGTASGQRTAGKGSGGRRGAAAASPSPSPPPSAVPGRPSRSSSRGHRDEDASDSEDSSDSEGQERRGADSHTPT